MLIAMFFAFIMIFFCTRWFIEHGTKYWSGEKETIKEQIDGNFWGGMISAFAVFYFMLPDIMSVIR